MQAIIDPLSFQSNSNSFFDFQPTTGTTIFEYHDQSKFSRIEEELEAEDMDDELNDAVI